MPAYNTMDGEWLWLVPGEPASDGLGGAPPVHRAREIFPGQRPEYPLLARSVARITVFVSTRSTASCRGRCRAPRRPGWTPRSATGKPPRATGSPGGERALDAAPPAQRTRRWALTGAFRLPRARRPRTLETPAARRRGHLRRSFAVRARTPPRPRRPMVRTAAFDRSVPRSIAHVPAARRLPVALSLGRDGRAARSSTPHRVQRRSCPVSRASCRALRGGRLARLGALRHASGEWRCPPSVRASPAVTALVPHAPLESVVDGCARPPAGGASPSRYRSRARSMNPAAPLGSALVAGAVRPRRSGFHLVASPLGRSSPAAAAMQKRATRCLLRAPPCRRRSLHLLRPGHVLRPLPRQAA